jgi:hypothetical protein
MADGGWPRPPRRFCHLPSAICHLPSAIRHLPSAICHQRSGLSCCAWAIWWYSRSQHTKRSSSIHLLFGDPAIRLDLPKEVVNVGRVTRREGTETSAEAVRSAGDRVARAAGGNGRRLLAASAGQGKCRTVPVRTDQLVVMIQATRSITRGMRVAEAVSTSAGSGQKLDCFPRGCAAATPAASAISSRRAV